MTVLSHPLVVAQLTLARTSDSESHRNAASGIPFIVCDESGREIESDEIVAVHELRCPNGKVVIAIVLRGGGAEAPRLIDSLTRQEMVVANLIAEGLSTKAIAYSLDISQHTARHHTESVFRKLGVRTRVNVANVILRTQSASKFLARGRQ